MKRFLRGPLIYIVIILVIVSMSQSLVSGNNADKVETVGYTQLLDMIKTNQVAELQITNYEVVGLKVGSQYDSETIKTKHDFKSYIPNIQQFNDDLKSITGKSDTLDYGLTIDYVAPEDSPILLSILPYLIPIVLLVVLWFFIIKQSQGGGGKAMSFGKSKARMATGGANKKTFADVAGADEEKEELKEIVDFLKNPRQFTMLGARIPKGVLLVGPPGGGKTLLAKAVAGEAGVPFFSISGSDFVEMFVGVGASRVRDMFDNAKKNAPCIIFIDEIDAVGRHRGAGLGGGHDEREQTLNQLLVEMDGFQVNEGIIVIAATNRKDILDPALLRPGRFDRQIVVNYPDIKGREEILKVHARGKPLAPDVDLKVLAKRTPGFIGADLENVLNEAAILTARHRKTRIGMVEIEEAITRVIAGPEKRSRIVTEEDKKCTAIHEVGHAICAKMLPNCDPVHEISIIPRGMAAGYTMTLPETDNSHVFKSKMLDQIAMMLGGRVAESILLNDISTGASNDLQRATDTARRMVINFGMSDTVGPIFLGGMEEVFLGRDYGHTKNYSEEMAARVDNEIVGIMEGAFKRAKEILLKNVESLKRISEVLIEREKIDGDEFTKLLNGEELPPVNGEKEKEEPISKREDIDAATFKPQEEVNPDTPDTPDTQNTENEEEKRQDEDRPL